MQGGRCNEREIVKKFYFSSDEEGSLSITAEKRSYPESRASLAGSTGQQRRPQRRPQLWKRKPVKEEEEEEEEGREEGEESRDNEYEDEDFGKCVIHRYMVEGVCKQWTTGLTFDLKIDQ